MFVTNKRFISIILLVFGLLLLFSLSNVSAATYNLNSSNTTSNVQSIINTDKGSDLIITLDEGSYSFSQINVNRNAIIQGKNKNARITGTGILFNITATNVTLINLTIRGYSTAVKSNVGGLTIVDNDIAASDAININNAGGDLKGIYLKNNKITSLSTNYVYGVVSISASNKSGAIIGVSLISNNITGSGNNNYIGVSSHTPDCFSNLIFENNSITGTYIGVLLFESNSKNTNITFTNNNIIGTNGVSLSGSNSSNINISFINNYITGKYECVLLSTCSNYNAKLNFINNNFIGRDYGVDVFSCTTTNSNIIFINNNITGTFAGVDFDEYHSNNINITFINNNITGKDRGVDVFAYMANNVNITFIDDNLTGTTPAYMSSSNSSNVNMIFINNNVSEQHNYTISVSDISGIANSYVNLVATLKLNGVPLIGKKINFYVSNKFVGQGVTNSAGVATFKYLPSTTGRLYWDAEFKNDVVTHEQQAILNVGKRSTVLFVNNFNGVYGTAVTLQAILKSNGSPVVGKVVNFYVNNGFVGQGTTDSSGVANLRYTVSATGTLSLKAVFNEDFLFAGSSQNSNLFIPKLSELKIINKALVKGKTVKISHTIANMGYDKATFSLNFKLDKKLTYKSPSVSVGTTNYNKNTRTLTWVVNNLKLDKTKSAVMTWNLKGKKGSYVLTPNLVKNNNIRLLSNNKLSFRIK